MTIPLSAVVTFEQVALLHKIRDIPPSTDATFEQVALLRKSLDYITAHREQWKQSTWVSNESGIEEVTAGSCGTIACLAGWAVLLAGHQVNQDGNVIGVDPADYPVEDLCSCGCEDGGPSVAEVATCILGLPAGHVLFDGSNTLNDLWRLARHYSGGEIEIPVEFS